jgi:hypothetical protein
MKPLSKCRPVLALNPYLLRFLSPSLLPLAAVALSACCGPQKTNFSGPHSTGGPHDKLIAHIEHDGLSFSIRIDDQDNRFLKIVVPEKADRFTAAPRRSLRVRVQMSGDSRINPATGIPERTTDNRNPIIEGAAIEHPPWVASGGWADVEYRFPLGRRVAVRDIHSVEIWIGNQHYTACPF